MQETFKGRRGFSRADVVEMRRAARWGHSAAEIGKAWGISETAARDIIKVRSYARVHDDAPDMPPQPLPEQAKNEGPPRPSHRVVGSSDAKGEEKAAAGNSRANEPRPQVRERRRPEGSRQTGRPVAHLSEQGMVSLPIPGGE